MDPELNPMPDFAVEEAFLLWEALMLAFGWNEDQAIQHLEATWCQAHLQQVTPPEPLPPQDPPADEQVPERPGDVENLGNLARQGQDKKKPTFGDFEENEPPPNVIACQPSQYTLRKTTAGEYVELWYFTKEGCFKATKHSHAQADDTFGLLSTNEVLTLRPVASVKASKNAKADHELSLMEMLQALTSYLEHIKDFSGT
jgi:hypothetical protein